MIDGRGAINLTLSRAKPRQAAMCWKRTSKVTAARWAHPASLIVCLVFVVTC